MASEYLPRGDPALDARVHVDGVPGGRSPSGSSLGLGEGGGLGFERYENVPGKLKVGVFMEFKNSPEARLGMPLPKGVVRVYKRDAQGRPQFVGEDAVDHTPRNEPVRLKLGDAFDVTATRKQTDFKSQDAQGAARRVFEAAFQVDFKNAKKEAVTVTVLEPIFGDWEMVQNSQAFTKETSGLARFEVQVPAEGNATLTYRVRMHW